MYNVLDGGENERERYLVQTHQLKKSKKKKKPPKPKVKPVSDKELKLMKYMESIEKRLGLKPLAGSGS